MGINIPWAGYTFNDGTPVLRILISGSDATAHEFDAIIDTGFNGFLSIPQSVADALGLERLTTERIFFADNSEHIRWTSLATITIGSQSEDGIVYLEPASEEVLLGVEFLQRFNRMMLFYPTHNFLHFIENRVAIDLINKFRP